MISNETSSPMQSGENTSLAQLAVRYKAELRAMASRSAALEQCRDVCNREYTSGLWDWYSSEALAEVANEVQRHVRASQARVKELERDKHSGLYSDYELSVAKGALAVWEDIQGFLTGALRRRDGLEL